MVGEGRRKGGSYAVYEEGVPVNGCFLSPLSLRYRHGVRGRMKAVILELLNEYHRVEEVFQGGSCDLM